MKIAIFTDAYFSGTDTVSSHVSVLEKGLRESGHEVLVITSSLDPSDVCSEAHFVSLPGKRAQNLHGQAASLFSLFRISSIINRFSPDVVQIETLTRSGLVALLAAKKRGIPTVTCVHSLSDLGSTLYEGLFSGFVFKRAEWIIQSIIQKTDTLAVFSDRTSEDLVSLGIHKKTVLLPLCTDPDTFNSSVRDLTAVQRFRSRLNLGTGTTGIFFCGALDYLDDLLDIWNGAVRPSDNLRLVIAGSGYSREEVMEKAKLHAVSGLVSFLGEISHREMDLCYHACDAFLFCSSSPDVHMSPFEAIACGLPVLMLRGGANADLIRPGVNGFVFENAKELRPLLLEISKLDATGKRMMRELVAGTASLPQDLIKALEAIYPC